MFVVLICLLPAASSAIALGSTAPLGTGPLDASTAATARYTVTFTEQGLPAGASWNLTLLGYTWSVSGTALQLAEPNGTFAYTAESAATQGNWNSSGTFAVAGHNTSVLVAFVPLSFPAAGASSSPPGGAFLISVVGLVAVIALVITVGVLVGVAGRRRVPGAPLPPGPDRAAPPPSPAAGAERLPPEESPDPLRHML